ncbi:MAG TPA: hypothetical protein VF710_10995 [Longimicrobium sp.]|jgi:hypothetical protein
MPAPGTAFELEVFRALRNALQQGSLGLDPKCARIFHHHPYYSAARQKNIFFDVAIELTLPGAPAPSFIWIWECKDYSSLVPVDDLEEFHSKLSQVGAAKANGTVITRAGFQASALNFAKSIGIGLARMMPDEQVDWILYRATPEEMLAMSAGPLEIRRALTEREYTARNQQFFGLSTGFRTLRGITFDKYLRFQLEEWGFPLG